MQVYFVVTALGVTIQELGYLNIKTGIICNYKEDMLDIKKIETYCKELSLSNSFFNFGYYKEVNFDSIFQVIEKAKYKNILNAFSKDFGAAWRNIKS